MSLSNYKVAKILKMATSHSIGQIAEKFGLAYQEVRAIINESGVKLKRGRKRGSGRGQESRPKSNGKFDRRITWQNKMIVEGKCTACGEPNDSESMYHCKSCLKKRNEQVKARNEKKKSKISDKETK